MTDSLALRSGVVIDAEFEEPATSQQFPEPPHGLAYFIYQGHAYVLRPKWLELIAEPGHEQDDPSQPVTRFRMRFVGLSRKGRHAMRPSKKTSRAIGHALHLDVSGEAAEIMHSAALECVRRAFDSAGGRVTKAAKLLGASSRSVYAWIDEFPWVHDIQKEAHEKARLSNPRKTRVRRPAVAAE